MERRPQPGDFRFGLGKVPVVLLQVQGETATVHRDRKTLTLPFIAEHPHALPALLQPEDRAGGVASRAVGGEEEDTPSLGGFQRQERDFLPLHGEGKSRRKSGLGIQAHSGEVVGPQPVSAFSLHLQKPDIGLGSGRGGCAGGQTHQDDPKSDPPAQPALRDRKRMTTLQRIRPTPTAPPVASKTRIHPRGRESDGTVLAVLGVRAGGDGAPAGAKVAAEEDGPGRVVGGEEVGTEETTVGEGTGANVGHGEGVGVAASTGVGEAGVEDACVAVGEGYSVGDGIRVGTGVAVGTGTGVEVGVTDGEGWGEDGGVDVGVGVGVRVTAGVPVGVGVGIGVTVGVFVGVGVSVAVAGKGTVAETGP
ncbi:MAG: hypothetical protein QW101_08275 [Ignisphaera sp.]